MITLIQAMISTGTIIILTYRTIFINTTSFVDSE